MTQAQHTPGPWTISDTGVFIKIYDANDNEIADVTGGYTSRKDDIANARLLAAAPELLEALELILPRAEGFALNIRNMEERIQKARAAIAKARGEAQS